MIFDKPSTRTRVSFDVGMRELGGETIMLTGAGDAARPRRDHRRHGPGPVALCRRDHDPHPRPRRRCSSWPSTPRVPVINGLTKPSHPCQIMADVLTFEEHRGPDHGPHGRLVGRRQQRAGLLGPRRRAASTSRSTSRRPPELAPAAELLAWARREGARVALDARSARGGRRAPTASSPIAGCRWATRTRAAATTCSSPTRSTPG